MCLAVVCYSARFWFIYPSITASRIFWSNIFQSHLFTTPIPIFLWIDFPERGRPNGQLHIGSGHFFAFFSFIFCFVCFLQGCLVLGPQRKDAIDSRCWVRHAGWRISSSAQCCFFFRSHRCFFVPLLFLPSYCFFFFRFWISKWNFVYFRKQSWKSKKFILFFTKAFFQIFFGTWRTSELIIRKNGLTESKSEFRLLRM